MRMSCRRRRVILIVVLVVVVVVVVVAAFEEGLQRVARYRLLRPVFEEELQTEASLPYRRRRRSL
jgi:hypothetical protein